MSALSKTDTPCDCGWLAMALNDPSSGVSFDAEQNRVCLSHGHSYYPLWHCPFCGGAFPDSSRPMSVPIVPQDEFTRLEHLIVNLTDAEDIIGRLGPPDYDAIGHSYSTRNGVLVRDDSPAVRNIEYYRHSEWLAIEFYIPVGKPASHRISIKALSAKHKAGGEQGARPNDDSAIVSPS